MRNITATCIILQVACFVGCETASNSAQQEQPDGTNTSPNATATEPEAQTQPNPNKSVNEAKEELSRRIDAFFGDDDVGTTHLAAHLPFDLDDAPGQLIFSDVEDVEVVRVVDARGEGGKAIPNSFRANLRVTCVPSTISTSRGGVFSTSLFMFHADGKWEISKVEK